MNDTEHIETTLRAQIPAALHVCVPPLAAVIADLQAGRLTSAETAERLHADVFAPLRTYLAGRSLVVNAVRLDVAPSGDTITVGDISQAKGVAVGRDANAQVVEGDNNIVAGPGGTVVLNKAPNVHVPSRPPFMAPDLPADFVPRPAEFERIVAYLLDSGTGPVAISTALRGAGGYGKTTLATAVCHDARVQAAFPDGVLWITLGEKPSLADLVGKIDDLIGMLSGELRAGFVSLEAATARLAEVLGKRRMLMVVDDVWDIMHLKPFLRGGPHTARLIATRNRDVMPAETQVVDVDAMNNAEALALLSAGLTAETIPAAALQALAARLGEWPLLLTLVNGALLERVRLGASPDAALSYVKMALDRRGLTAFDARTESDRSRAVAVTIGVSLELLTAEERQRYAELAIFPEDVVIPLAILTRYWGATSGLDAFATDELCIRLARLSLLVTYDIAAGTVRLHDVMRAYLTHAHSNVLTGWHTALLDGYRPASGAWANLPESETYLWEHLVFHLEQAGHHDELFRLVTDQHWWSARRRHDLTSFKLTRDIETARHIAKRGGITRLANYTTLSYLQAYLGTLVSNLPIEVVEILARSGQEEQAHDLANLFTEPSDRVAAWWRLGQWYLDSGDIDKAMPLLKRARDSTVLLTQNKYRPNHLARFALLFHRMGRPDETQSCLDQAMVLMEPLSGEEWSDTFAVFVRGMYDYPSELLQPCLEQAEHLVQHRQCHPIHRVMVLVRIAEQLNRIDSQQARGLAEESITTLTTNLSAPRDHSDERLMDAQVDGAISVVADVMVRVGCQDKAISLLDKIKHLAHRAEALASLSRAYAECDRLEEAKTCLRQAAQLVEAASEGVERDAARCDLVQRYLAIPDLGEAERIARMIEDATQRIEAMCPVLTYLSADRRVTEAEALLAVLNTDLGSAFGQTAISAGLLPSDPDAALARLRVALDRAKEIQEGVVGSRHNAYTYIAHCVRDIATARPTDALILLEEIIHDLQAEPGMDAITQYAITQRQNEALARMAEALAKTSHYTEASIVAQGITYPSNRDLMLLICLRYACRHHDWNGVDSILGTMTNNCWRTIGETIRDVAMKPSQVV